MNDEQFVEASRAFAERILTEGGSSDRARGIFAFRVATGRKPAAEELDVERDTSGIPLSAITESEVTVVLNGARESHFDIFLETVSGGQVFQVSERSTVQIVPADPALD